MFQALTEMPRPRVLANVALPVPSGPHDPRQRQQLFMSAWSWPSADPYGRADIPLDQLTVRAATQMLIEQKLNARREKHEVFWQMAHSLAAVAAPMPMGSQMGTLLGQLWRAPCCNKTKEPFWRLTVHALPTAQRRAAYGETCPCGTAYAGRGHHWWDCPVAKTVICEMQRQLNAYAAAVNKPVQQLSALNVWLAEVPDGVKPWLWQTVCMAAVAAMDHGRNVIAAQAREAAVSGSTMLRNASNGSVAHFWSLLEEAAASRRLPTSPAAVAIQPFFRFCGHWTVARVP